MDYRQILDLIKIKLPKEYSEVQIEIEDIVKLGSTGGEINAMIGFYLKNLEEKNKNAYEILKEDIKKYIMSCENDGLIIN